MLSPGTFRFALSATLMAFMPGCVNFDSSCEQDICVEKELSTEEFGSDSFAVERERPEPGKRRLAEQAAAVFYESWVVGADGTVRPPAGAPAVVAGDRSSLITFRGGHVFDNHIATVSAAPAVASGADLIWVFSQCYGGGMLDDLGSLGGSQVIASASRHNEPSYYRDPTGAARDWLDEFLTALGPAVAVETVAAQAAANDPFGPNPVPAPRAEPVGAEHPQFFATRVARRRGGVVEMAPLSVDGAGGDSLAILWSGQPHQYDAEQMDEAITKLLALGYTRDRIVLLYGSGRLGFGHPLVARHIAGAVPPVHLRAATEKQLDGIIAAAFRAARLPPQLVFIANDHGGTDAGGARISRPRISNPEDEENPLDQDAESPSGDYGAGDQDDFPEFE